MWAWVEGTYRNNWFPPQWRGIPADIHTENCPLCSCSDRQSTKTCCPNTHLRLDAQTKDRVSPVKYRPNMNNLWIQDMNDWVIPHLHRWFGCHPAGIPHHSGTCNPQLCCNKSPGHKYKGWSGIHPPLRQKKENIITAAVLEVVMGRMYQGSPTF